MSSRLDAPRWNKQQREQQKQRINTNKTIPRILPGYYITNIPPSLNRGSNINMKQVVGTREPYLKKRNIGAPPKGIQTGVMRLSVPKPGGAMRLNSELKKTPTAGRQGR